MGVPHLIKKNRIDFPTLSMFLSPILTVTSLEKLVTFMACEGSCPRATHVMDCS